MSVGQRLVRWGGGAARLAGRSVRWAVRPLPRMWRSAEPLDAYALVHMSSAAGDALVTIALAGTIFFQLPVDQARVRVAAYLALTMAPLAVAGPILVPLLDRGGFRRGLAFAAAAGRAAAAAFALTHTSSLLLFPAVFAVLVLSRIHGIVRNGLVAAYANGPERLIAANARLSRLAAVSVAIASLPAALVTKLGGAPWTLGLAACAYAGTALLAARLHPIRAVPRVAVAERPSAALRRGRMPSLRTSAAGMGALRAAQGFLVVLVAFALRREGAPAIWLVLTALAGIAGGVTGDLLGPRVGSRLAEELVVLVSLVLAGLAAVLVLQVLSLPTLALFALVAGLATETGRLGFQSLMQREAPGGLHGRVFVRYEVAFQLAWVAGAFVPAMIPIPLRMGIAALGTLSLLTGVAELIRDRTAPRR